MRLAVPRVAIWVPAAGGFVLPPYVFFIMGFSPFHQPTRIAQALLAAALLISCLCAILCCVEACRRFRESRSLFRVLLLAPIALSLLWPTIVCIGVVQYYRYGPMPMGFGG